MPTRYDIAKPCRIAGTLCVPGDVILHASDGSWLLLRGLPAGEALAALSEGCATVQASEAAAGNPPQPPRTV